MRFAACLKKDIRLLTGGGVRSLAFLALPVALVLLMSFLMGGVASKGGNIRSFDIAVRDLDGTIMSRMLISQLENVKLFDHVIRAGETPNEELTKGGCAAVVTIPKDFFYDLYEMKDTDVVIALNGDMPNEAGMVRSAFTSLMGILEENQRIYYAEAKVRFGDLTEEETEALFRDYSAASVEDALGRLSFFELSGLYKKGFDSQRLFFCASMVSMLIMFIPLSMLRSISEETESGLAARFTVAGGSMALAVLSKLVISLLMTFIPVVVVLSVMGVDILPLTPVLCAGFLLSFAFFLLIGALAGRAQTAQLIGNVVMLLVLTLGGALFPFELLSEPFKSASAYMLPRVILKAMEYPYLGLSPLEDPVPIIIMAGIASALFLAALPFLRPRRRV